MDKRSIERERQSPPDQNSRASEAPWTAKGCILQDADGQTIAVADREADARLMGAAPRMAAILWLQLDAGLIDAYFRKDVEEALRAAGRALPVQDGGNGHGALEAQQQMLVASIAALGREPGLALGRSMFTVWHRLPPGDDEAYIVECLATEGDLDALRAVIARWLPRLFVEAGGTDGRN